MPAKFTIRLIGSDDHDQCVPSHDGGEFFFDGKVARKNRLLVDADAVDVGRSCVGLPTDLVFHRHLCECIQHKLRALWALALDQAQKRLAPLLRLEGVDIDRQIILE